MRLQATDDALRDDLASIMQGHPTAPIKTGIDQATYL